MKNSEIKIIARTAAEVFHTDEVDHMPVTWTQLEYGDDLYWLWAIKQNKTTGLKTFQIVKEESFGTSYIKYEVSYSLKGKTSCTCEAGNKGVFCRHQKMLIAAKEKREYKVPQQLKLPLPMEISMPVRIKTQTWEEAFKALDALPKFGDKRNLKIEHLRGFKSNKGLIQLFRWAFNGDKYNTFPESYGTKRDPKGFDLSTTMVEFSNLLLALKERTVSGHAAKEAVAKFFDNIPRRIGKWLARVMNHDLRSGTKISLITAAMGENVWEDNAVTSKDGEVSRYFGCSLAHHYASWPKGWEYALVEPKLDGWRVVAHVGQKSVTFYTRNGKHEPHTSNLQHVAKQLLELGFRNCVVDGEIVIGGQWNATALMRHKNPTDEVKTVLRDKAVFHVFDYFGLDSSLTSIPEPNMAFSERRKVLYKHLKEGSKNVKLVKQWKVTGPVGVQKAYKLVLKRGYEGLMIKDPTAPYAFKRGRSILKLKPEREIDVYVVGCKLGSGKHAHRLGTLLCKKADGVEVRVGSGWSDKEREELWRKRKTLIGKWLEAKETDPMQKAIKFNHPRFIRWRPELDKN